MKADLIKIKTIEKEIEHYHRMLSLVMLNYLSGEELNTDFNIGAKNPLCRKYIDVKKESCARCPVGMRNNNSGYFYGCANTPHECILSALDGGYSRTRFGRYKYTFSMMGAMIDFLINVRKEIENECKASA